MAKPVKRHLGGDVKRTVPKGKARGQILEATIALLLETRASTAFHAAAALGDIPALTVRAIAKKAGVGVGLVNYHFGDKKSLIREAVRLFIGMQIIKGYGNRLPEGETLRGRIADLFRGPIGFLAEFPALSRVSVLYDLTSPVEGDNSDETFKEIGGALLKIVPPDKLPPDLEPRLWAAIGAIHEAFLRPVLFKARTGLDFSKPKGRAALADFLAGLMVREVPEQPVFQRRPALRGSPPP
jgi:AcrR family transcriptional regulator